MRTVMKGRKVCGTTTIGLRLFGWKNRWSRPERRAARNIGRDPQLKRRYLGTALFEHPHATADIAPKFGQFGSVELGQSAERCV
jgi:hypothetical protein